MNDIVGRLRAYEPGGQGGFYLIREAADEIERLRAELIKELPDIKRRLDVLENTRAIMGMPPSLRGVHY